MPEAWEVLITRFFNVSPRIVSGCSKGSLVKV
jgi:hypothetical protein